MTQVKGKGVGQKISGGTRDRISGESILEKNSLAFSERFA